MRCLGRACAIGLLFAALLAVASGDGISNTNDVVSLGLSR